MEATIIQDHDLNWEILEAIHDKDIICIVYMYVKMLGLLLQLNFTFSHSQIRINLRSSYGSFDNPRGQQKHEEKGFLQSLHQFKY